MSEYNDETGRSVVTAWIPDSSRFPLKFLVPGAIDDLNLSFYFDEKDRLVRYLVREESRF
jgi:hypothetical protein